jgi:hypothetical protein
LSLLLGASADVPRQQFFDAVDGVLGDALGVVRIFVFEVG